MKLSRIRTVTFSPAGSTEAITDIIAERIASKLDVPCDKDNFTLPETRTEERHFSSSELVLFSVPTYAGRIPNKILPFVQTLFYGEKTPVVPIVTFGNRAFDESLKELRNELKAHGFYPIAAAALVSRHVFSKTLGKGRPDHRDMQLLDFFASDIADKILATDEVHDFLPPVLPRNAEPVGPYYTPLDEEGNPARFLKAVPQTDLTKCDHCGICAPVCPMGSVSAEHPEETTGICIKCQACILKCPRHARCFTDPIMLSHTRMLEKTYQERTASSIYLPRAICRRKVQPNSQTKTQTKRAVS